MSTIYENPTIGGLAKAANVTVEMIRFYQRKGLLAEPDTPYGAIRRALSVAMGVIVLFVVRHVSPSAARQAE
ncbi:MAG: MerR family DNA-binding transcriptional regulator [Paraburkholderia sp.]|nr:MAG: MerR family DNA-binding transcriptional regulator [Paraburkholderia sp.]